MRKNLIFCQIDIHNNESTTLRIKIFSKQTKHLEI